MLISWLVLHLAPRVVNFTTLSEGNRPSPAKELGYGGKRGGGYMAIEGGGRFGLELAEVMASHDNLSADAVGSSVQLSGSYIRHFILGSRSAPGPEHWSRVALMLKIPEPDVPRRRPELVARLTLESVLGSWLATPDLRTALVGWLAQQGDDVIARSLYSLGKLESRRGPKRKVEIPAGESLWGWPDHILLDIAMRSINSLTLHRHGVSVTSSRGRTELFVGSAEQTQPDSDKA